MIAGVEPPDCAVDGGVCWRHQLPPPRWHARPVRPRAGAAGPDRERLANAVLPFRCLPHLSLWQAY